MARRYTIHLAPFAHMNGKLAPSSVVCHNQPDSSETENVFYYGYRYAARPEKSRYAIRDRARNLSENPYTAGEERVKAQWRECVDMARELLQDATMYARILAAFRRQRRYVRIYNYVIAELVMHNATIPPEWR